MTLRLSTIATALLLTTACHHTAPLTTISLEWRAPKVPYKDSILKVINEKHLQLAFGDLRTDKQKIARYGGQTVTVNSDVAAFCTQVFQDRFKALGVGFVNQGAAFTLQVDLQQWFAEETDKYRGMATVSVALVAPDGSFVWKKQLQGKSEQGGRDHTQDNYNETLSSALVDVMGQLLKGRDFETALLGHEPAPDVVALPAPKLPSGPTLHLVWRGVDEAKPMGSESTINALRSVAINVEPLVDTRTQPLAIGRFDNAKGQIVYTPDNVAAFYSKVVAETLKTQGVRLDPNAKLTLSGEIVDLIVVENNTFKATARLRFTLKSGDDPLWTAVVEGKSEKSGKDHSSEQLSSALSNAYADAMRGLLSNKDLAAALK